MRRLGLAALCALAAFAATPAQACMSSTLSQHLLDAAPGNAPAGASAIRVHFTNRGPAFLALQDRVPWRMGPWRTLVAIAQRLDGLPDFSFPVYAWSSSCAPDFFGPEPREGDAWLVGRFQQFNGQRVFVALARSSDGRWEPFNLE